MKTKAALVVFGLVIAGLLESSAQSLRGKVIYISPSEEVTIKFGSVVENYSFVNKHESANFKVNLVNNKNVVINSVIENFRAANLVITENGNTHLFILRFKNKLDSAENFYDFSTRAKLRNEINKMAIANRFPTKNPVKYPITQPVATVEQAPKPEPDSLQKELDARHADLIARADKAHLEKNYDEATSLYTAALALKPDDSLCISQLKVIQLTRDLAKLEDQKAESEVQKAASEDQKTVTEHQKPVVEDPKPAVEVQKVADQPQSTPTVNEKSAQEELDNKYTDLIAQADKAYQQKNYDEAIGLYTAALALKPNDSWSNSQLNKVKITRDLLKLENQRLENQRLESQKLENQRLENQKLESQKAADQLQIELKAAAEAEQKQLDTKYAELTTLANKAYRNKNYDEAAGLYMAALVLKPNDAWCTSQLNKVQSSRDSLKLEQKKAADQLQSTLEANVKAEQKRLDLKYADLVALADKAYGSKSYDEAIGLYKAALLLKPNDKWCTSQLKTAQIAREKAQTKDLQASAQIAVPTKMDIKPEQKSVATSSETKVADLISRANKAYIARKYDEAVDLYTAALTLKPNDSWCVSQLKTIEKTKELLKQNEFDTRHAGLIARANKAYVARKYEEAKKLYVGALTIKPDDPWCISQLKTIHNTTGLNKAVNKKAADELEAAMKAYAKPGQKESNRKYTDLVTLANNAYAAGRHAEANDLYTAALRLKPEDGWCISQLSSIQTARGSSKRR